MSAPSLADLQYDIGTRIGRRDWDGAAAAAAQCRAAWPSDSAGWLLGSIAALFADDKETACALMEERLAGHPLEVDCLLQKAECLLALGRRADSLSAAAAAAGATDNTAVLDAIGEFLVHAGDHPGALQVYDRAVAQRPAAQDLLAKRAVVHRFLGNFELAADDYRRLLTVSPNDNAALKGLAELQRQSAERNSLTAMHAALDAVAPQSQDAATLHFGLAKSYEDLGKYADSWQHLATGNRLARASITYRPDTDRAFIDRIIGGFPNVEPVAPETTAERPIFIVGLPRTGTTLVERILGSHSAVHAAGELPALSEAIASAVERTAAPRSEGWLDYAAGLGDLDGRWISRAYLARAAGRRGNRARFSDKQPVNFLYCGLIARAFPHAPIVHVTRHPLATCYAIYKTLFGGSYPFAYDLQELAAFYLNYRRLMAHWHRILPGRILDLSYEALVSAQESTTRRLLAYAELPFESACLDFHLNPASTATASSVQVRMPLYDSSVDQWRHFAAELEPVRRRLEAAGIAAS